MDRPKISLVVATYNRAGPLRRLLGDIRNQDLARDEFEVLVAVDGSTDDTLDLLAQSQASGAFPLRYFWQQNTGQAGARHEAIQRAQAERIAIVDDDMELHPAFLREHLRAAAEDDDQTVVIGKVLPEPGWQMKPLFEAVREHHMLTRHQDLEHQRIRASAEAFATGNVSLPRRLYLAIGGFDSSLRMNEDVDLGTRLEIAGARFVFAPAAWAIHRSDVGSYETWERRQYEYGKLAVRTWEKNDRIASIHPLLTYVDGSRLNRAAVWVLVRNDSWTRVGTRVLRAAGAVLQAMRFFGPAIATHKAIRALQYHLGVRHALGSWQALCESARAYETSKRPPPQRPVRPATQGETASVPVGRSAPAERIRR